MPFENASRLFVVCVLLLCGLSPAMSQDSLYEKALDAEGAGDVSSAVHLFEMAYSRPGPYTAEIGEILAAYYDALQIDGPGGEKRTRKLSFLTKLEMGGIRYDEPGGDNHEFLADAFWEVGAELSIPRGEASHRVGISLASEVFFHEPNTAFDTTGGEFSASVVYSFFGKRGSVSLETGMFFPEDRKNAFFVDFWGKRELCRMEAFAAGVKGDVYGNSLARFSASLGGYLELFPGKNPEVNFYFAGRFDGDTSVFAYFKLPAYDFEEGFFPGEPEAGFSRDSVEKRFYVGRRSRFGPEFRAFAGYGLGGPFSLEFFGDLFLSYAPQRDRWLRDAFRNASWNRFAIQGLADFRVNFDWKRFEAYVSLGAYFLRYFRLPEDHPEISSNAALREKARMGSVFRF